MKEILEKITKEDIKEIIFLFKILEEENDFSFQVKKDFLSNYIKQITKRRKKQKNQFLKSVFERCGCDRNLDKKNKEEKMEKKISRLIKRWIRKDIIKVEIFDEKLNLGIGWNHNNDKIIFGVESGSFFRIKISQDICSIEKCIEYLERYRREIDKNKYKGLSSLRNLKNLDYY